MSKKFISLNLCAVAITTLLFTNQEAAGKSDTVNISESEALESLKEAKPVISRITQSAPLSRGTVSSNFGMRGGRMHNGIDIAADAGTPINTIKDGVVFYAGWEDGYGNVIIINHENDLQTIYGHCSIIEIKTGEEVKAGQLIGRVGSTGRSTGPHLHFEVREKGVVVDPGNYIPQYIKMTRN